MHCQRTVAAHFVFAAITALVSSSYGQTQLTINANRHYSIGGVSKLDREQYFVYVGTLTPPGNSNLGDLPEEIWSNQGLNTSTGRVSTELASSISNGLPEDPNRPGFYDPVALRNKLQLGSNPDQRDSYRAFVTGKRQGGSDFPSNLSWVGARWEVLREADNPILVTSGRNGGQWPDFLDGGTSLPTSHAGYADFLNIYLEETVYGTGPNQGFLPISPDRFYIEIVNEPNWPSPSQSDWNQVIQLHQTVTELVKEQYPQAKLGGPSCCDGLGSGINGLGPHSAVNGRHDLLANAKWRFSGTRLLGRSIRTSDMMCKTMAVGNSESSLPRAMSMGSWTFTRLTATKNLGTQKHLQ